MAFLKGIDISTFQDNSVITGNLDFVMIKASEGINYKDDMLDNHYNYLHEKFPKMKYGFYHYARPDLGNNPHEEAKSFLNYVGHHSGKCLYALDWEGKSLDFPWSWAEEWLQYVYDKTDAIPLLYASESPLKNYKGKFPLWVASWDTEASDLLVWAMWQYSNSNGKLDLDYFNNTAYKWEHLCKGEFIGTSKPTHNPEWKITFQDEARIIMDKC